MSISSGTLGVHAGMVAQPQSVRKLMLDFVFMKNEEIAIISPRESSGSLYFTNLSSRKRLFLGFYNYV